MRGVYLGRVGACVGITITAFLAPLSYGQLKPQTRSVERRRRRRRKQPARGFALNAENVAPVRLRLQRSDQTASSFPDGSRKWNRRPPGKLNVGLTMTPPAAFTLASMASRSAA